MQQIRGEAARGNGAFEIYCRLLTWNSSKITKKQTSSPYAHTHNDHRSFTKFWSNKNPPRVLTIKRTTVNHFMFARAQAKTTLEFPECFIQTCRDYKLTIVYMTKTTKTTYSRLRFRLIVVCDVVPHFFIQIETDTRIVKYEKCPLYGKDNLANYARSW